MGVPGYGGMVMDKNSETPVIALIHRANAKPYLLCNPILIDLVRDLVGLTAGGLIGLAFGTLQQAALGGTRNSSAAVS
jgi:hypothetical protein